MLLTVNRQIGIKLYALPGEDEDNEHVNSLFESARVTRRVSERPTCGVNRKYGALVLLDSVRDAADRASFERHTNEWV